MDRRENKGGKTHSGVSVGSPRGSCISSVRTGNRETISSRLNYASSGLSLLFTVAHERNKRENRKHNLKDLNFKKMIHKLRDKGNQRESTGRVRRAGRSRVGSAGSELTYFQSQC